MTIERRGEWLVGSERSDLDDFLRAVTEDGYPADVFRHAVCQCGEAAFQVEADPEAGAVRRSCSSCGLTVMVGDSGEFWDEAEPEVLACVCGGEVWELAVGFSHRDDRSIRWLTVGVRCVACGRMGGAADWKIDYAPSDHPYDAV